MGTALGVSAEVESLFDHRSLLCSSRDRLANRVTAQPDHGVDLLWRARATASAQRPRAAASSRLSPVFPLPGSFVHGNLSALVRGLRSAVNRRRGMPQPEQGGGRSRRMDVRSWVWIRRASRPAKEDRLSAMSLWHGRDAVEQSGQRSGGWDGRPALACHLILNPHPMSLSLYPTLMLVEPLDRDNLPAGLFALEPYHGDVVRSLSAMGDGALVEAMQSSMDPEEARNFSLRLFSAADAFERQHRRDLPRNSAGFWRRPWNSDEERRRQAGDHRLEQILREVREAARWYKSVGENGLGVYAAC